MGTSTVPASPCTRHRPSVGLVGARRWPSTGCSRLGWASPGGSPSFTLVPISPVFSVLIVPRVTVGVVDKTGGSAVKVVANVPFGVAFLGSVTSTVGHTLTGLFETAFQVIPGVGALPSELSYEKNGLMFGNRLIRETGGVAFQDPNFRTDLVNFIHNCTMYDLIDGTVDPGTFSSSDDVWALMASPNPARFTTLTSAGGSITVDTCPNAYTNLNGRLPAQLTRIQGKLAFQLNPTLPAAAANAAIAGQIQQAYLKNSIATAAATAADLIRQNAVLNAINDTSNIIGQKVNDPAAMVLAVGRAQSVAQQNAAWLNAGKVAEQALPVFRNVIEAITYALFPLLVLLMLLTSGRETMLAFKGYAAVLIWIQLWPPLYAVLNYMASIYAAYDLAAAADLGSGAKALSLQTASTIYSRAISGEAVVGYLAISIPFIAWAALKRMETFGTALVGGLPGLQSMVAGATAGAAAGNLSMGNVSMDQIRLAPNRTSAFMSNWQNDISGNTFSSNMLTGRTAVSLLRNQGYASRVVSMRVSEQDVQDASRQVDAARSEAVAASTERSAVLSEAFTKGLAKLKSSRSSTGATSSSFEQLGQTIDRLDQISRSVSESTGLTQSQVARIALGVTGQGRDYNPSSRNTYLFEPYIGTSVGTILNFTLAPTATLGSGATTALRTNNAVAYFLPKGLGGLYREAMIAPSEGAPGNKYFGARLGYAAGPFDVSAAYGSTKTASSDDFKQWNIGLAYKLDSMKLLGLYNVHEFGGLEQKTTAVGLAVPVGLGEFRAMWAANSRSGGASGSGFASGDDSNMLSAGYVHNLSKRTALYGFVGRISNDGAARLTVDGSAPAAMTAGETSSGYQFGITHRF
jgi:hypothetical protein